MTTIPSTKNCHWHRINNQGRVHIAKELRDQLGIKKGDIVMQVIVGDHIELHKVKHAIGPLHYEVK